MADEDVTLTKAVTVKANGAISVKSITVTTGTIDIENASNAADFAVNVAEDVTLSGTGAMYVRAGKTEGIKYNDWEASAALLWANANKVNIGGKLTVGSGATLYSANDPITGTPVVFRCANLEVGAGGTISSKGLGFKWQKMNSLDETPDGARGVSQKWSKSGINHEYYVYTYAFSAGNSYGTGPGHGGAGNDGKTYGKPYGYECAPFLSGSQPGQYQDNAAAAAGGAIVLFVSGKATIAGTINAMGNDAMYGAASGGSVWLTAATAEITPSALLTVEGGLCTGNYGSGGPGGRLCIGLGLSSDDIAALARGETPPEGLTVTDAYGFPFSKLGGGHHGSAASRVSSGTAKLVYRPSVAVPRSVAGWPSDMGVVTPNYGFYGFKADEVPEFTAPDAIYPDGYRQMRRFGTVEKSETEGDQPGVVWNFLNEQYLLHVGVNGTGAVSDGDEEKSSSFEKWYAIGETVTLTASGDGVKWTGDFAGGFTEEASVTMTVDAPRRVQATFADATGTARAFVGENGGFWEVAANWDPAGVPTPLDDLTIPSGKFVRGVNALAAKSLTVGGFLALGGETDKATKAQKLTDVLCGFYGLHLTGDLSVSGGVTLGAASQNSELVCAHVGGDVTLSSSGTLAVYAPEQTGAITTPFADVFANRMVVTIGGNFTVGDTAAVYPVGDPRTGTPIDWEVGGDFTLAAGAKVTAENLGFNWTRVNDSRKKQTTTLNGDSYYSLAPGSPGSGYQAGASHGAGTLQYGSKYGPFMLGSPSSIYSNFDAGGGSVWIHARGQMNLAGKVNADGTRNGSYSGGSGGSIWLLAKKIQAESTALLSTKGGRQSHSGTDVGAGTGGRISLGIGLTDEAIAALATGGDPAELDLTVSDDITLVSATARGGEYAKKGAGSVILYAANGTLTTVTGESEVSAVAVQSVPVPVAGVDYETKQCERGKDATFTAPSVSSVAGEETSIRYHLQGWVVSNATEEVAHGTETSAVFPVGKDSLTLTWVWGDRETRTAATANDTASGSILVNGEESDSGEAWVGPSATVTFTAVPAEGAEFLYWIGDVPFGRARAETVVLPGSDSLSLTAVFRTNEVAMTRTWKGGGTGKWLVAENWEPKGLPGLRDDVVVNTGTVTAPSCLEVGSLKIGGGAKVLVATTAAAGAHLEEARVTVAGDLVMDGKGQLSVGAKDLLYHGNVSVGGDLLMLGTNVLLVAAGAIERDFTFETGAGWVTVGGLLKVGEQSAVYPISEGYTGGSVVFRSADLVVERDASFNAVNAGYQYYPTRSPSSLAKGVGGSYTVGGGYGGMGVRHAYENPYESPWAGLTNGFAYAPVHPGASRGNYRAEDDTYRRGGGLIRLHAQSVRIDGTLNARAADTDSNASSGSGGGIWVTCAGKPEIGPTAKFLAKGGWRCTDLGYGGGGGRIALAGNVTDAQVAEMARTGTVAAWKPKGWHFQSRAKFEAEHPGVTIDVEPGQVDSLYPDTYHYTVGTFWYLEGNDIGLMLLVK